MTNKKEISELTLRFQARGLTLFRKLFFDLQERDYSTEIRSRAVLLQKAVKAEDYPEAKSQADNIAYLFKLLHVSSYIQDSVYKSLAVDAAVLSATIEEAVNGDLEPEEYFSSSPPGKGEGRGL